MSLRRGGTPLTGAPPSLEAANQAQIEDLVQRNRTLEHRNTKLTEQLAQEAMRTKEAVAEIQRQWEVNQQQWKEGCEEIIASYRIVQKQVEVELERERSSVIREMKITREEKLQRLRRDNKIKLFQMNEEALERKIEELEEEKNDEIQEVQEVLRQEREKLLENGATLKETREACARSTKDKKDKEARYNELMEQYSNMEASTVTLNARIQRTQLKFEGAQNKIAELERANADLRRANTDLNNHRERWENLETKGGEAQEMEHKRRIALELELNEFKEQYETQTQEFAKAKKKAENMKDVAANYEAVAKEQMKIAEDADKKLTKLQKQVDKLKSDLEEERARVRPPSPRKIRDPSPPLEDLEDDQEEPSEDEPTPEKKSTKKPNSKQTAKVRAGPSTTKAAKPPLVQTARKSTGGKAPPSSKSAVANETSDDDDDDDEPEVVDLEEEPSPPPPRKQRKGKAKAIEVDDAEEVEEVAEVPAPRKRGKRKAPSDEDQILEDSEVHIVEKPKPTKKGSKAQSELREVSTAVKKPQSKARGGTRPASKQAVEKPDTEEEDAGGGPKKKKRKIFPTAATVGPFAFDSLSRFDDNNALNIPSVLSPVKPDEPVPQRSSGLSFFGGAMKSFTSRK